MKTLVVWLMLCFTPTSLSAATGDLVATLPNPAPEANAQFGYSVSGTGVSERVVIGAPFAATQRGRLHVFDTNGHSITTFNNPHDIGQTTGALGFNVSSMTNGFIAGAPHAQTRGVAMTFTGTDFTAVTTYPASPTVEPGYGWSVAANTSRIVAGNPFDVTNDQGGAFNSPLGAPVPSHIAPQPVTNGNYGAAMAILSNNDVIIGAPGGDGTFTGGAIYHYTSSMTLRRRVGNPSALPGDRVGASVGAIGTAYMAGAPGASGGIGRVDLFSFGGAYLSSIQPPDANDGDFGYAISSSDNYLAIGAPGYDAPGAADSGRVYVFRGGTLELLLTIENPTPAAGDRFGASWLAKLAPGCWCSSR